MKINHIQSFFQASPFALSLVIPIAAAAGLHFGQWYLLLTPILAFIVIPFSDFFIGKNFANPDADIEKSRTSNPYYRFFLSMHVPAQLGLMFLGLSTITDSWSWFHIWLAAFATGISTGGMGITVAHEFVHSKNKIEYRWGELLLSFVFYKHFAQEHVLGHHVRVATKEDPATARFGESVYRFILRTIPSSLLSAYRIDDEVLKRKKKSFRFLLNRMVHSLLFSFGWILIAYLFFGFRPMIFLILQALTAILLLEMVNYVEHYGLARKKNDRGHYENIKRAHSWNINNRISNYFLFNLQRHSDHHLHAYRVYQNLHDEPTAPQLPYNYPIMVLISLIPPLWRKVVHPLLENANPAK